MPATTEPTPWWIRRVRQPSAKLRLFCFPFAGGSASVFASWPKLLPPTVEVLALQLPGRENRLRETPLKSIEAMVSQLAPSLEGFDDLPFAFFGYSLGGLIAFETARMLRRTGRTMPDRLFVAATRGPQCGYDREPLIHKMSDEFFFEELKRFQGTPASLLEYREAMMVLMPMLRADFEAVETYQAEPESPLNVPIAAYGGLDDPEVRPDEIAAWSDATSAGFSMRFFPGDHFFLRTSAEPLLAAVSRELVS